MKKHYDPLEDVIESGEKLSKHYEDMADISGRLSKSYGDMADAAKGYSKATNEMAMVCLVIGIPWSVASIILLYRILTR